MITGIYKITNKQNGKVYIGQSVDCERRISEHKKLRNVTIDDYINILGIDNFDFEIIDECSKEELDEKEKFFIEKYDSKNNGYNLTIGGSNCAGESNGRAKMAEEDIIKIRQAYNQHKKQKEVYEDYKNKITWNQFQAIWQGRSWSYIMPEVYTEENKEYYRIYSSCGENGSSATLTNDEVLKFRKEYTTQTAKQIYEKYSLQSKLKLESFQKMLTGESYNKDIPVYKKKQKQWYLNGEPVSTISVSGE